MLPRRSEYVDKCRTPCQTHFGLHQIQVPSPADHVVILNFTINPDTHGRPGKSIRLSSLLTMTAAETAGTEKWKMREWNGKTVQPFGNSEPDVACVQYPRESRLVDEYFDMGNESETERTNRSRIMGERSPPEEL